MESKAKHAVHASAFFVIYVVNQKFLNNIVTITRMFKLFYLNILQIHVFTWPTAMSKHLHPYSFVTINHWKLRRKLKITTRLHFLYFSHFITSCGWIEKFTVSIYRLPSNNAVRCRQLLCRSCLAGLYAQFYGPQPARSWWSVICLGYFVSSMEPDSSLLLITNVGHGRYPETVVLHTHTHTHTYAHARTLCT
jgi:hypothetical protein